MNTQASYEAPDPATRATEPAEHIPPANGNPTAAETQGPATETPVSEPRPIDAVVTMDVSGRHSRHRGEGSTGALPSRARRPTREIVRSALIGDMGFRSKETDRVLAELPARTWELPLAEILRGALKHLTPPKQTSM